MSRLIVAAIVALAVVAIAPVLAGAAKGGKGKVIKGSAKGERISGTSGGDRILGRKGNDKLLGRQGADKLLGGKDDDKLLGQKGKDKLFGGKDDDKLFGQKGKDKLRGNKGADKLRGNKGADKLLGDAGPDKLVGGKGADKLVGGKGPDKLKVADGGVDKRVDGGDGKDLCIADFADVEGIESCETVRLKSADGQDAGGGGGSGGGSGGSGGGSGGGTGGGDDGGSDEESGEPEPDPGALTIDGFAANCAPQGAPRGGCQFEVNGGGADTPNGSVTVKRDGEEVGGGSAAADPETGDYQGTGVYECPDAQSTATLTVAFGTESVSEQVPCTSPPPDAPSPPSGSDNDLTITSAQRGTCQSQPSLGSGCSYMVSGTGADGPAGSSSVMQGDFVVGGGPVTADLEDGSFTGEGNYGCQQGTTSVTITVQIAGERSPPATLPCS